jgi:hypothetical protein
MDVVDGHTGQSGAPPDTVWCASHITQPLGSGGFWPLEALSSSGTGQTLFTVRCASDECSDFCTHCSSDPRLLQSTVAPKSRCSTGAPDSPVAHRTVRWIIAEHTLRNPRVESWTLYGPGAPDTVRWHTRQFGAPDQGTLRFLLLLWIWTLSLIFYWFVLNLYAPVEHVF